MLAKHKNFNQTRFFKLPRRPIASLRYDQYGIFRRPYRARTKRRGQSARGAEVSDRYVDWRSEMECLQVHFTLLELPDHATGLDLRFVAVRFQPAASGADHQIYELSRRSHFLHYPHHIHHRVPRHKDLRVRAKLVFILINIIVYY